MGSNIKTRLILDIFIILSLMLMPWWFTSILIAIGIFVFGLFYEALVFGLIMDSLYGVPKELFFEIPFVSFVSFFVLLVCINWFKNKLRI